jgi:hypothetical protein
MLHDDVLNLRGNQDGYLNRGFMFDNGTNMPSSEEACLEKAKKIVGACDCVILCLYVCLLNVCVWVSLQTNFFFFLFLIHVRIHESEEVQQVWRQC